MSSPRIDHLKSRQWCHDCYGYGTNELEPCACTTCQGSGVLPLWHARMYDSQAKLLLHTHSCSACARNKRFKHERYELDAQVDGLNAT